VKEWTDEALNTAKRAGADYVDIRIVRRRYQSVEVKNGTPEAISESDDYGFGVRVLYKGCWGFAASFLVDKPEIIRIAKRATDIAHASYMVRGKPVELAPNRPKVETYETPYQEDPFAVSLEEKLALLVKATQIMQREKAVRVAQAFFRAFREDKTYADSDGAYIRQLIMESGAGITATAVSQGEMQVRSYPNSFRGNFGTTGYEFVRGMKLTDEAERVASEAVALLTAPDCPDTETTLIIDGSQMALQIHESIGHAVELDRVFGMEASYAGTSFVKPEMQGNFRYGSDLVNVVADATHPGGLGTFGYDDEGVPAQKRYILKNGIFSGFLTNRETASQLPVPEASGGTARADGYGRIPIIRMTNINLLPGDSTLEKMISETKHGLLIATNRSWSIDDKRYNFQFTAEIGWLIENGQRRGVVKNPTYYGITPMFWGSCDAIAGEKEWRMWGTPNCGKGEPGQTAHVGHGASPTRFRGVKVGSGKG